MLIFETNYPHIVWKYLKKVSVFQFWDLLVDHFWREKLKYDIFWWSPNFIVTLVRKVFTGWYFGLRSRLHLAKLYLHCKIQLVAAWCLQLYRCKESKIFFCFKYYCNGLKVAILLTFLFSSPKKSLDNNQWFNTVLHSILMGGKRCSSNYFLWI